MKKLTGFDELDIEFILGVQDRLEQYFNGKATEVLFDSTFLKRLRKDPDYVYHYDEFYWADRIKEEFEFKLQ